LSNIEHVGELFSIIIRLSPRGTKRWRGGSFHTQCLIALRWSAEQCLAGHPLRIATASALGSASLIRIEKNHMMRAVSEQREFSDFFLSHLLTRTARYEEDLIDQLFNSSEKRLARLLLLLANFGKEGKSEPVLGNISQETLAEMIGTTRSRVSHFMNKFRKMGLIEYNGKLLVNSSLLHVVLNDKLTVKHDSEPEER
jgi:hypothetical protein